MPAIGDLTYFIPPDEKFSREKGSGFLAGGLKSILHGIQPLIEGAFDGNNWDSIAEIRALFKEGLNLEQAQAQETADAAQAKKRSFVFLDTIFNAEGDDTSVLNFPVPQVLAGKSSNPIKTLNFCILQSRLIIMFVDRISTFSKNNYMRSSLTLVESITVPKTICCETLLDYLFRPRKHGHR